MVWYVNGQFVNAVKAVISVTDLGFQRGWGVFDYLRTYNHQPFCLEEHLNRLFRSAKSTFIKPPVSKTQLWGIVDQLISKNDRNFKEEMGIKLILTAGTSSDGVSPTDRPALVIMILPIVPSPKSYYKLGIKLALSKRGRTQPTTKSIDYLSAMLAMSEAKKRGFNDALFIGDRDQIFEATRSNFFLFHDNKLITPKRDILLGITRALVIRLAKEQGFPILERDIFFSQLDEADEAFITNTSQEVVPVTRVENKIIGSGKVGARTKCLIKAFQEMTNLKK